MKLKCQKCGHSWDYKGSAVLADCPSCHTRVPTGKTKAKSD
jgi:predicted  nucleic acid-binding Zn-ribbon protein